MLMEYLSRVQAHCVFIVAKMRQRNTLSQFKILSPTMSDMETTPRPSATSASGIQQSEKCKKHAGPPRRKLKMWAAAHKFWVSFSILSRQPMEAQNTALLLTRAPL